jgi:hypothetical protein
MLAQGVKQTPGLHAQECTDSHANHPYGKEESAFRLLQIRYTGFSCKEVFLLHDGQDYGKGRS